MHCNENEKWEKFRPFPLFDGPKKDLGIWIPDIHSKVHIFWEGHKIFEIFTLVLSYVAPVKIKMKISQNFVASSEFMNFKSAGCIEKGVLSKYFILDYVRICYLTIQLFMIHVVFFWSWSFPNFLTHGMFVSIPSILTGSRNVSDM